MGQNVSRTFASKSFHQRRWQSWQSWQYPTTFPRSRMSVNNVIYMRILPKKAAIKDDYNLGSPADLKDKLKNAGVP
ncbi:uncharacterized protein DMAD_05994 [Drosophila madeirensis]|uniref:Uncharacterized protein n=1 Tax=Drosophila madeirensis TaxID=30013 RepID=A0AAU9FPR6_DROMD